MIKVSNVYPGLESLTPSRLQTSQRGWEIGRWGLCGNCPSSSKLEYFELCSFPPPLNKNKSRKKNKTIYFSTGFAVFGRLCGAEPVCNLSLSCVCISHLPRSVGPQKACYSLWRCELPGEALRSVVAGDRALPEGAAGGPGPVAGYRAWEILVKSR